MARNISDLSLTQGKPASTIVLPSPWKETVARSSSLDASFKGKRLGQDIEPFKPYEPGVLDVCKSALKVFESIGCAVDETQPDYPLDAVWQAVLRIRGWQQGGAIFGFYNDPAKRALLKPEAIYEIELGLKQSAYDITAKALAAWMDRHVESVFRNVDADALCCR